MLILFYDQQWGQPLDLGIEIEETEFSIDRSRYSEADAVVFHLPEWPFRGGLSGTTNKAPEKRPQQLWIGWSMECEEHYPFMKDPGFMSAFDLTMTYRRNSDIPLNYVDPFGDAAGMIEQLRRPAPCHRQSPLLASFISSPYDRSGRRAYLQELARYLAIDSYGAFMQNRKVDPDFGRLTKLATIAGYKFTIAFENACAEDYVTEKLFDPLLVGSVPIYLGAPNVEDFAPGDRCIINAIDFATPRALAEHLIALSQDDCAYLSYFEWKENPFRRSFEELLGIHQTSWLIRLVDRIKRSASGIVSFTHQPAPQKVG